MFVIYVRMFRYLVISTAPYLINAAY